MKKLIISLPFLIYYCVMPVNYDKAAIEKGGNFYFGANGYYMTGRYSESGCGYTSYKNYKVYGSQVTGGAYYGFTKNIAAGVEASGAIYSMQVEGEKSQPGIIWGHGDLFLKLSMPSDMFILSLKGGFNYPNYFKAGVLLGIYNPELLTLSYTYLYPQINTFSINLNLSKNKTISAGYSKYIGGPNDFYDGFYIGIGLKK
ncbi:MAG: hypothetical protein ABIN20_04495 [candidate division WOR-3 bacterium]